MNYYPAFPYTSYSGLKDADVIDLYYYLKTLPESSAENRENELSFPYSSRKLITIWKLLNQNSITNVPSEFEYGRYLTENLGHCGECHTPRKLLATINYNKNLEGSKKTKTFSGAPALVSSQSNISTWSVDEINYYLRSGFTPDYDSSGGSMAKVIDNLSKVADQDTFAIANYLKFLQESRKHD